MTPRPTVGKRFLSLGGLEWVDRSYVIDWAVVGGIWTLSWLADQLPVFERPFNLNDPLINYPYRLDTVSSRLNNSIALFLPILIFVIVGYIRGSLLEIHHGTISNQVDPSGLARLITVFGKHALGRLRPDFLARCGYDQVLKQCTGPANIILTGRKSFPSGHSSTAFSGMTMLSLWLAGLTAAWCFSVPTPPRSLRSSKMGRLLLTLVPLLWASFVAVSRVQDYRHHKEDVIVGSLIGIISAGICYLVFWPSPFSPDTFDAGCGIPRSLYTEDNHGGTVFRLARREDDEVDV